MTNDRVTWSEEASDTYRRIAAIAVPCRREQIATLLTLIPFDRDDEFKVVELGSGEGRLAAAILDAFPKARLTALDGSATMRQATAARLAGHAERFEVAPFDLLHADWLDHLDAAGLVVSALVVHHLDDRGKQALFRDVRARMAGRGALLVADLLHPKRPESSELFAESYEQIAREQSFEVAGSDAYYQDFVREEWNHFRYPDDDADQPAPLYEQLRWLDQAGFEAVDCFWLRAGHAIYGGYVGPVRSQRALSYERASEMAARATA